jgi:hypothetical protein
MEPKFDSLLADALAMAADERVAFAQILLASVHEDPGIDEAWAEEVERRIAEVEAGTVQLVPMSVALAQVRDMLK